MSTQKRLSVNKSYKITHLGKYYPPHMGGIEIHLRDLVRYQAQSCSVEVIVANDDVRTARERIDGAELIRLGCLGSIKSMPVCPALPWFVNRSEADLIHMHMPNPAAAFAYIVSRCRIPLVITHHSDTVGRATIRRLSDPFVQEAMRRASRIIVTSRCYADTSSELKLHRDKVDVVPYGINPSRFSNVESETVRSIRSRYGPRIVVAVGRLVPFKGFDVLIRAMQKVRGNLLVVGDGPQRRYLEEIASDCRESGRVFFTGTVDNSQIADYLSAADVFVIPSVSRAESFGIVQLEAMASGLPVINTDIDSGVREVSIDGQTGITVAPGDASAMSEAIRLLLDRPDLRQQFGKAAKARVKAEYSAELMCMRTMNVYDEAMKASVSSHTP
ncbi:MAG TPA: glycosyltransferase [Terracidiphilus sp.]